ncbi:MAG: hypothetical protein R3A47_01805 [Polyangiales bacterium]
MILYRFVVFVVFVALLEVTPLAAASAEPTQISTSGGSEAIESSDGSANIESHQADRMKRLRLYPKRWQLSFGMSFLVKPDHEIGGVVLDDKSSMFGVDLSFDAPLHRYVTIGMRTLGAVVYLGGEDSGAAEDLLVVAVLGFSPTVRVRYPFVFPGRRSYGEVGLRVLGGMDLAWYGFLPDEGTQVG